MFPGANYLTSPTLQNFSEKNIYTHTHIYIYTHTHIVPKIFWELHVLFYHHICFTFLTEKTYQAVITKTNIKMKKSLFSKIFSIPQQ